MVRNGASGATPSMRWYCGYAADLEFLEIDADNENRRGRTGRLPVFQWQLIPALALLLARTLGRTAEKSQVQALRPMQRHP